MCYRCYINNNNDKIDARNLITLKNQIDARNLITLKNQIEDKTATVTPLSTVLIQHTQQRQQQMPQSEKEVERMQIASLIDSGD